MPSEFNSALAMPVTGTVWLLSAALLVFVLGGALTAILAARRLIRAHRRDNEGSAADSKPRSDNPTAFMAASMQAVIQKLCDQEKELEALHRT